MKRFKWNELRHRKWFWPLCVAIVILCLAAAFLLLGGSIRVTPTDSNEEGVAPDSRFRISGMLNMGDSALRKQITVTPAFAYQLSEAEEGGILMTPLRPLEAGQSYTIQVGSRSFSFQVRNTLIVTSSFPADGSQKVPVRTGIEFEFNSSSVPLADFQRALTIEPALEGSVTAGNGRFIFYADGAMDYETTYTVTLSPPLKTPGGAALEEAVSFSFTTQSVMDEKSESMFQFDNIVSYNTIVGEAPLIQAYMQEELGGSPVSVKLYRFPDLQSYQEQLSRTAGNSYYDRTKMLYIDTQGLEEYASFEVTPFRQADESNTQYYSRNRWIFQFPNTLPEGWYAAEFTAQGESTDFPGQTISVTRQLFLQVSDLSVFHMMSGPNLLLWVNDASTGEPVSGAVMEVTGSYSATAVTGEDGVAAIDTGVLTQKENDYSGRDGGVFTITAGDHSFVDVGWFYDYDTAGQRTAREYIAYLYTDRPIYRTTDTVKVWGLVRPRSSDTAMPETLILDLGEGAAVQQVKPKKNGTFTAELSFEAMTGGSGEQLRLRLDDEVVLWTEYLSIEDYVKPTYTADAAPEKPVYLLSDPNADPAVGVEVSFFDGTPAADFGARVESWDKNVSFPGGSTGLRTDENGRLRIPMRIGEGEGTNTWYPQTYNYTVSNEEAEGENFYLYQNLYAIHRDVMLRGQRVESGPEGEQVKITTHRVDISRITDSDQLWDPENLQGQPLSQQVEAQLHRIYYTREKTGTQYDFISRTTVDTYDYQQHDDVVETYSFTTSGGSYLLEGLPVSDEESCYYLVLTTSDSTGRAVTYEVYLSSIYYRYSSGDGRRYVLDKEADPNEAQGTESSSGFQYPAYSQVRSRFGDGEDVTFRLMENDQPMDSLEGRMLYVVVQDDFSHITVTEDPQAELPFSEKLVPNYIITGAYFDGKHIFAIENKSMIFDPGTRELEIQLETDAGSYGPGDQVQVTALARNKDTGKPAAGAELVLSVVDEAIFAMREQTPDILAGYYRSVYYPTIQKYTSFIGEGYIGAGEKGGGGGDSQVRKDFQDTAYFAVAQTDSSGKASFQIKLPDNITSWRFTSAAVTDDGQAGDTKINVSATQEFFVSPIVSELSLSGDSFAVGLRSAGTGISSDAQVQYTVTVRGEELEDTMKASGEARDYQSVIFPALAEGEYTVTVSGQCGDFSDAVELPFSVTASGVEVTAVKTFDLSGGVEVSPLRWPVTIAVYDESLQGYNQVFRSLDSLCWGTRTDFMLARLFLARQFEEEGSRWYDVSSLEKGIQELTWGDPLPLFPYDNKPDMELTTLAVLAMPDDIPQSAALAVTPESIELSGGRRSVGYLAQAAADALDAKTVIALLEEPADLDFIDQMYLVAALAEAGEQETAAQWYEKLTSAILGKVEGLSGQEALYIPQQGQLTSGDCTAAALVAAVAADHSNADGLAIWLAEKKDPSEPHVMEQLFDLQRNKPKKDPKPIFVHENGEDALVGANELNEDAKAQFSYVRDGTRITKVLDRDTQRISFTKAQLAEADFRVPVGSVWADVYYTAAPQGSLDAADKKIPLTKTVEAVDSGEIRVGSVVKITLTPDLSAFDGDIGSAQLVIDDYVPTGMRFEQYGSTYEATSDDWWLASRQGQRLKFIAYGDNSAQAGLRIAPIVYYARCAAPGDYVVESAYISSAVGSTWGSSDRDMVTIQ